MKKLLTFIKGDRFAREETGGTLAELAILIPFLVVMVAAVSELGRMFQTYNTLSKSTRAAARYMSNVAYTNPQISNAKNIAVCGKTNCTGVNPVVANLTADNIDITAEFPEGGAGNPTTVKVQIIDYNFQPLFNLAAMIPGDRLTNLPISATTTMYYMWVDPAGAKE